MNRSKHLQQIAEQVIRRLIDALFQVFLAGRAVNDQLITLHEKLQGLDNNNADFAEFNGDRREALKLYWRLLIILFSIGIDFLLTYQGLSILIQQLDWPVFLKYLVPIGFILLELAISYFQIIHQRTGEQSSWFVKNAQYFLLLILTGLTVLVIIYSIQMYNPALDFSFWSFLIGIVGVQLILLISSILLHVWLIKHAEEVAECVALVKYKIDRQRINYGINTLEQKKRKHAHLFSTDCFRLVQKLNAFRTEFPNANVEFSTILPRDLAIAVNKVMGKTIFAVEEEYVE